MTPVDLSLLSHSGAHLSAFVNGGGAIEPGAFMVRKCFTSHARLGWEAAGKCKISTFLNISKNQHGVSYLLSTKNPKQISPYICGLFIRALISLHRGLSTGAGQLSGSGSSLGCEGWKVGILLVFVSVAAVGLSVGVG